jgi:integrase
MRQLTDLKIRSLRPAANGKPYDIKDTQVPGLHVRVMPTGHRSFVLLSRFPGKPHPTRRALGGYGELTLEEARDKAREWRRLISRGIDPQIQEERDRQATLRQQCITFEAVAEDFIREKLPTERKGKEVEQDIRRELIPRWAERPITDIAPLDVRNVVKAIKDRGALYQAHNTLVTIRRLFGWTIQQHVYGLESSPCDRLKPKAIVGKRLSRTRILDNDELRAFWRATRRLGYPYQPLYRMLALTGQRRNEVGWARWSEINLEQKLWTIPAERMKGGAAHVVPLTDDVLVILKELPHFKGGDYLFSSTFGKKPVRGFNRAKRALDGHMLRSWRALGRIRGEDRRDKTIPPFVVHDVRRTVRTGLSALPIPDLVRELVVAHSKPGLHKVYDLHVYEQEKRHALTLWAARLHSIVEPAPANVVELPRARARL